MTRKNGRRLGPAVALVTAIGLTSACGDATEARHVQAGAGPDEGVIARLVENVADAQGA
ncbi:hypothetical protein [Streptomyces sp. VB1]|uniref:hypothetical protein n=1 Tax=Streptomyces sp. VB1 TaxID=2986803 RepID=UPI00224242FF|nr:hypothetical protein [Streptomyces sp. VB1]UZI33093.1 hypothetical protein OH133_36165 [Streptomyces sp. VB1]